MATYSEALQEAFAGHRPTEVIYNTIELDHPDFTEPARLVQGYADITARMEADAPRNPGELVQYVAADWDFVFPTVAENQTSEFKLTFDNVSREISDALRLASESQHPVTVRFRMYLDGNLTVGPETDPPFEMEIRDAEAGIYTVEATASMEDIVNAAFSRLIYTTSSNPSLAYVT